MDRRQFLRIAGFGTGAAVIAGPGDLVAAATRPHASRHAAAARFAPGFVPSGTVTVWVHESVASNTVLKSLFEEYMAANPDVTIDLLEIPYAEFETKALTSTSAGEGPGLIKIPGWSLPDWADKGLLVEVTPDLLGMASDEELTGAFAEGAFDSVNFDGRPYALPVDYQNLMLFYRPDQFEEAGLDPASPPTTWEQVVEYGQQLTVGSGDEIERSGFTWWYSPPIWVYLELLGLVSQLGGSILNEDASGGNLNNEAGLQAVQYYIGMSAEDGVAAVDLTTSIHDRFRNDAASMFVSGSFTGPVFTTGDITLTPEDGTLAVAPIPVWADAPNDVTAAYAWGWGVTSNADDPQLAGHLARFLGATTETADRMFVEGGIATPYAGFAESAAASETPWNEVLVAQIPKSVYGPRTPQFARMMDDLMTGLQAGALGEKSAEQVAEEFDRSMERVLR